MQQRIVKLGLFVDLGFHVVREAGIRDDLHIRHAPAMTCGSYRHTDLQTDKHRLPPTAGAGAAGHKDEGLGRKSQLRQFLLEIPKASLPAPRCSSCSRRNTRGRTNRISSSCEIAL